MSIVEQAAENFIGQSESLKRVVKYGRGIINDTYLVELDGQDGRFILQRVNTHVFKQPELVMHNLRLVCEHIHALQINAASRIHSDWEMLHIIPTRGKRDYFIDLQGGFWRAFSFIRGAHSLESIGSLDNAREAGRALGIFHQLTGNLNPDLLHDTLPGFHNIGNYLNHYDQVLSSEILREYNEPAEKWCRKFVEDRREWAPVLEDAQRHNKLQMRITHGDLKINNIMFDNHTGKAVSIIDLDTIRPGLLLYDLGDCLRSCCNISGEEADDLDAVRFDLERCKAIISGYMGAAQGCFAARDFDFFFDAIRLVPFELGLRFYIDYLEGNPYFQSNYPAHGLDRAMVQFRLVESIERQEESIREIIEKSRFSWDG